MESVSYKIKIRASINGVEKIPSKIVWVQGNDECLLKPCYKENDYLIVELIPDCVGKSCIEGWLIFDDTCSNCEPIHFKRCFCSTDGDCGDCEECNQQGICQSKCLENEYCLDNTCVECDPNKPCPNGKICKDGKCICPSGYFEKDGRCVQCDETTILNKCQECINGRIVDKICDGKCDPTTGQCIDCLTSGDCFNREDGRNCCNSDTKTCECCPGTIWSAEKNKCIPLLCTSDEDCNDPCLKCTEEGCKPMICPPGMKCWKGDCIEWPCTNTSCENGADCGPDCGCVEIDGIKQCVPCSILECLGLCEQALGCKCNSQNKCEPVDDCNDYCDGETPCLNPNCTCYNNRCVSCENFPCDPNDCDSRPNCGCTGGDCEGGAGCNDKLKIVKDCGTNKSDCKLTAQLTSNKGCKCDDIRFETENIFPCTTTQNTIKLKVNLYKGEVNYNNFLDLSIGDNEFVQGIISTNITHYDINDNIIDLKTTKVNDKSINLNSVQEIEIKRFDNYSVVYTDPSSGAVRGTKVKIDVIAKNIQIPNNDCIDYTTQTVIASYTLNFRDTVESQICSIINSEIDLQKKYVNDLTSTKRPLFIWSKSATDFPAQMYEQNANYDSKGWFRKEYGVKTSTGWEDVLSTLDQGLVNNYNYVVKVDCGCSKLAVHNALDFCCLADITPVFENCNTKLKFPSFKVCEINGAITNLTVPDFNKAYYQITIIHAGKDLVTKQISFNNDGVTTLPITYEDLGKGRIVGLRLTRYFKGGLLQPTPCHLDIPVDAINIPEVIYSTECLSSEFKYNITLNQVVNGLKIIDASFIKQGLVKSEIQTSYAQTIVMGNSPQKSITIPLKNGNSGFVDFSKERLLMQVSFEGGCSERYILESCEPSVSTVSIPDVYSGRACPNPTDGPTIEVTAIGFTENVQYSFNNSAYQTSNQYTNAEPGTYSIKVKDIINGEEVIVEDSITIIPKIETEVTFSPPTLCAGQTSTLTIIGEPSATFTIKAPNGTTLTSNAVTNAQGIYTYPNISVAGEYTITNNSSSTKYCNTSKKVTLTTGGEVLNPTITFQEGSYCVGQPIPFRIFDNGKNRTYNLSTTNGSITTPLQATDTGFNGEYIPSSTLGSVTILSSTSSCDTMTPVLVTTPTAGVSIVNGPIVSTPNVSCVTGLHTVSVNITGATSVTIGGVTVTPVGTTYTRTGITGVSNIDIVASNGSCDTTTNVVLQNCDCPTYEATIGISAATCGQGAQTIFFTGYSPNLIGTNYQLQEFISGQWSNISSQSGTFSAPTPEFIVNNQVNNPKSYRVLFTDNNCFFETDSVTTSATQGPTIIIVPSIPNNVPTSTNLTLQAVGGVPSQTSYVWSGLGVNGNTGDTVNVVFDVAGSYAYSVTATTGSCVTTANYTVIVENTCGNAPTISGITNLGSCQNPTANNPMGGTGAYSYAWSIDGGLTTIATTLVLDGSLITPGATETLTFTITDAEGCFNTYTAQYTRCEFDYFELAPSGHSTGLGLCTGTNQVVLYNTKYKTSCIPVTSIDIFVENIINDGVSDIILSTNSIQWGSQANQNCGSNYALSSGTYVDNTVYGGVTITVKTRTYLGTDNTGILLGTAILGTVTIPVSC